MSVIVPLAGRVGIGPARVDRHGVHAGDHVGRDGELRRVGGRERCGALLWYLLRIGAVLAAEEREVNRCVGRHQPLRLTFRGPAAG